jgi:hypothetical protein
MLGTKEFNIIQAGGLIESLMNMDILNIYSKLEIDTILSEAVKTVIEDQRREFDKRMELAERRIDNEIAESRSRQRWLIGTIICGLSYYWLSVYFCPSNYTLGQYSGIARL